MDHTQFKKCNCCNKEKSVYSFANRKNSKDGLQPLCKECSYEKTKKWKEHKRSLMVKPIKEAKKLTTKQYNLTKMYNLSLDEFNQMSVAQDYKCKCCNTKTSKLHVLQNKKTKTVYGLVCSVCSKLIAASRQKVSLAAALRELLMDMNK